MVSAIKIYTSETSASSGRILFYIRPCYVGYFPSHRKVPLQHNLNILQAVYGETRNNSLFSDHIQEDLSGTNITLVSQAYTSAQKIFK